MKNFAIGFGVLAAVLVMGTTLRADDEDALAKAPPAVQAAAKAVFGKNKLAGFDPETEGGKTTYEVTYEVAGGGEYAVILSDAGAIIQREVEVDASIVPPSVMDAAKKAHPDGTVSECNIINAGDKLFYEIETKVGKDTHELQLDPTGTISSDKVAAPEAKDPNEKPEADEKKDADEKK